MTAQLTTFLLGSLFGIFLSAAARAAAVLWLEPPLDELDDRSQSILDAYELGRRHGPH